MGKDGKAGRDGLLIGGEFNSCRRERIFLKNKQEDDPVGDCNEIVDQRDENRHVGSIHAMIDRRDGNEHDCAQQDEGHDPSLGGLSFRKGSNT
ncbi:MAG: hypothetical protein ACR652_20120 [Methylocystis sp.]|uniref:hypothetical protein n=1 Tax=Methylocystis sp. TaxID=1911079 RepID=UPI003DA58914